MKELNKPSIWYGLIITLALILVAREVRKYTPPLRLGKVWITNVNQGFKVNFRIIGEENNLAPRRSTIELQVDQLLYPVGDEVGSTFKKRYYFKSGDYRRKVFESTENTKYIYTASTPAIKYREFSPPSQSGVTCRIYLSFLDYTRIDHIVSFKVNKELVI